MPTRTRSFLRRRRRDARRDARQPRTGLHRRQNRGIRQRLRRRFLCRHRLSSLRRFHRADLRVPIRSEKQCVDVADAIGTARTGADELCHAVKLAADFCIVRGWHRPRRMTAQKNPRQSRGLSDVNSVKSADAGPIGPAWLLVGPFAGPSSRPCRWRGGRLLRLRSGT